MINQKELEKFIPTYSLDRITSFIYSPNDTMKDVIERYHNNVRISQALYPELTTLEIILRNSIDSAFRKHISETWLEDEVANNNLLEENDYNLLISAYNTTQKECLSSNKELTAGRVIANLNFGFWTNLCMKKYNSKIWNKIYFFKGVFVNYPSKTQAIGIISQKLYAIRKLRNRVFHYEQIFRYPQKTLKLYNEIIELLSYLPNDNLSVIQEVSTFIDLYNKLTVNKEKCNKKT